MPATLTAANSQILGWNNLGMHCMDSDYSVFSVLPPYNTIEAQLIVAGKLVTNGAGYTVTYQAVADPDGSFNATAMGKNNYYDYAKALYGATLGPEGGLAGWNMPGTENEPQAMLFEPVNHPAAGVETPVNWWRAEGIPISPYDDAHRKNPYPLMRIIATGRRRNSSRHQRRRPAGVRRDGLPRLPRVGLAGGRPAGFGLGLGRISGARLPLEHPAPPRRTSVRTAFGPLRRSTRRSRFQFSRTLSRRGRRQQTGSLRFLPRLGGARHAELRHDPAADQISA